MRYFDALLKELSGTYVNSIEWRLNFFKSFHIKDHLVNISLRVYAHTHKLSATEDNECLGKLCTMAAFQRTTTFLVMLVKCKGVKE